MATGSSSAVAASDGMPKSRIMWRWKTITSVNIGSGSIPSTKLNSLPFNPTGEKIQSDGTWCVYEFTWQMDAILFWHRFQGRWLRGDEFHYPEVPQDFATERPATTSL